MRSSAPARSSSWLGCVTTSTRDWSPERIALERLLTQSRAALAVWRRRLRRQDEDARLRSFLFWHELQALVPDSCHVYWNAQELEREVRLTKERLRYHDARVAYARAVRHTASAPANNDDAL